MLDGSVLFPVAVVVVINVGSFLAHPTQSPRPLMRSTTIAAPAATTTRHRLPQQHSTPSARNTVRPTRELVERGHVTADDFKAFTHDNALALWGDEMFADTVIAAR
jgi:hypothetical protein